MLCDIFDAVQPLNLVLQKGDGLLCLYDLQMYLNKTLLVLEKIPDKKKSECGSTGRSFWRCK